jgi:cysteine-rich repeat protein
VQPLKRRLVSAALSLAFKIDKASLLVAHRASWYYPHLEIAEAKVYPMTRKRSLCLVTILFSGCTLFVSNAFVRRACGDGLLDTENGEQCDDGNVLSGDGCDNICQREPVCGNSLVEANEVCDDGNLASGDGCRPDCQGDETCGDGFVDAIVGEQCDDNNTSSADGCSLDCTVELGFSCSGEPSLCTTNCGDNLVAGNEQCDDGNQLNADLCEANCTLPACGNNINDIGEHCDDGNTASGDGCTGDCSALEVCGNNFQDVGEACDDGNNNNGDACESNCTLPACGNNINDIGEQCDDGNINSGDGCGSTCQIELAPGCGDGALNGAEECDDGNTASDDGCSQFCTKENLTINSFSGTNCQTFEHTSITGDDRGGLVVGSGRVLYTGDITTTSFDLDSLPTNASFGFLIDAPVSDLRTGKIYSLGTGTLPLGQGGQVSSLLELDPITGNIVSKIDLSAPFNAELTSGIFSGRGRIVVLAVEGANTFVRSIDPITGVVSGGGAVLNPSHELCESWAYWGVAEFFNNEISVVYTNNPGQQFNNSPPVTQILRTNLTTGVTTVISTFTNLADMCSIGVSLQKNRWYFHHEFTSEFVTAPVLEEEFVGFCDAQFTF